MSVKRIRGRCQVSLVYGVSRLGRIGRALLVMAAVACVALLNARAALAQDEGRQIEVIDWVYHVPLAIGCILFVVVVDAVVIYKFVKRG